MSLVSPVAPPAAGAPPPTAKPHGNPNLHLAPRCGARTRAGCPCRAPAIHGKLRCRMHGGRSTGPRTPEGRDRVRAARTVHGDYGAEARALNRYRLTVRRTSRTGEAATLCQAHLSPALAARLYHYPEELRSPPRPIGGITAAEDRDLRHAVAASLAPWRAAIAEARAAARAAREAARGRSASRAEPHAPVRPRRRAAPPRPGLEDAFAAAVAELHALVGGAGARGTTTAAAPPAAPTQGRSEPHAPERGAGRVVPVVPPLSGLHAPERAGDAHAAAPRGAPPLGLSEPRAPMDPRSPTPPHKAIASLHTALAANPHAQERAADARVTGIALPADPSLGLPKPHAPDPVPPAPLNRAARRRLKWLQRHRDRAARTRP